MLIRKVVVILVLLITVIDADCPYGSYVIPDSLGSGWQCAFMSENKKDCFEAESDCRKKKGFLISIPNGFVNNYLASKFDITFSLTFTKILFIGLIASSQNPGDNFIIGITNIIGDTWRNIDNSKPAHFFEWDKEEPNNSISHRPGCIRINSQSNWATYPAFNSKSKYICGLHEE